MATAMLIAATRSTGRRCAHANCNEPVAEVVGDDGPRLTRWCFDHARTVVADLREGRCLATGCTSTAEHRHLCDAHYSRWRRHGSSSAGGRRRVHRYQEGDQCRADCDRAPVADGLCLGHYRRVRTGSPLGLAPMGVRLDPPTRCTIDGCDRKVACRGMCRRHYDAVRAAENSNSQVRNVA